MAVLRNRGVAIFAKACFGHPSPSKRQKLNATAIAFGPQPSCVHATSPLHRKLGAGYVALPQMTGRRVGKPFILSPPTLGRVRGSRSSRLPTEPCVRVRTRLLT